jgi:predicted molibdopterin-dependent oxidoreductase YjgC
MMTDPDQRHVRQALENLEFLAVAEIFPTLTTELADVVLPAASYAEKEGTFTSTERRVQRVRRAVDPVGDSRADWQIICALAARAGRGEMRYDSPEQIMHEIAAVTPSYGGISYPRIDKVGLQWPCPAPDHPGTPVLHVETFARGRGAFGPAAYRPPMELPDDEYPFLLTTGRNYFHFHSGTMTRRSSLLHREERFPYVEISPEDARALGIRDQQWVLVSTRRGEVKSQARVTETAAKGLLFMTFHFEEAAANLLTLNALDPEAKIPEFKVCAARIRGAG